MTSDANRGKGGRDRSPSDRERVRAQGLRPISIRVPDSRTAAFRAAAHRQSLAVAQRPQAREDQDFIETVARRCCEGGLAVPTV